MTEDEVRQEVEGVIESFFKGEEGLDTMRVAIASVFLGPNADKIAKVLGLKRGSVRLKGRRLRAGGLWGQRRVLVPKAALVNDATMAVHFSLMALVAEGVVTRTHGVEESTPPASDGDGVGRPHEPRHSSGTFATGAGGCGTEGDDDVEER